MSPQRDDRHRFRLNKATVSWHQWDMLMPTPQQIRQLAALAVVDPRTVRRAYREPHRLRDSSRVRIARTAQQLGLPPPPLTDPPLVTLAIVDAVTTERLCPVCPGHTGHAV